MSKIEKPNLILVGYRTVGKSTVAKKLSSILQMPCVSTDKLIEDFIGTSISAFVAEMGWAEFRKIEAKIVSETAGKAGQIIDCGGGVVETAANIKVLKKSGRVFWLRAPVKTIIERMKKSKNRPALTGLSLDDEVKSVLERRNPLYEEVSDTIIDVTNSAASVAKAIAEDYAQA